MGRHEVDRVRRCHLRWNDQVAFIFAVFIINEDIHAAIAGFFDNFLNRNERRRVIIRKEIAFQLTQCFRRWIPACVIQITQGIGMQPRRARKARARQSAFVDEITKLFN